MKPKKELKDLNLMDRFLFAEAAERSGSLRIQKLQEKVAAIKSSEEMGGEIHASLGRKSF